MQALQILENELKNKFFGGENIGIVDIVASYIAFWLPILEEAVGLKFLSGDKFAKLYNLLRKRFFLSERDSWHISNLDTSPLVLLQNRSILEAIMALITAAIAAQTVNNEKPEKGVEESLQALQILENELKNKFVGGGNTGIVDIAASYIAFWLPTLEEAVGLKFLSGDKFAKLYKWSQEFINHPIVKEILPLRGTLGIFQISIRRH
ncbi:hypothetical protein KIW84_076604 [Lathyrus oleraceus]|uniref:GST C-terminal domain-containing protein n=1 Tax=Pisum sativum TaxID=3888 RepID=A0A9D5A2L4_PEA|nr:hypothetical protein KIW84_076604 [Pisum sativum]